MIRISPSARPDRASDESRSRRRFPVSPCRWLVHTAGYPASGPAPRPIQGSTCVWGKPPLPLHSSGTRACVRCFPSSSTPRETSSSGANLALLRLGLNSTPLRINCHSFFSLWETSELPRRYSAIRTLSLAAIQLSFLSLSLGLQLLSIDLDLSHFLHPHNDPSPGDTRYANSMRS